MPEAKLSLYLRLLFVFFACVALFQDPGLASEERSKWLTFTFAP